MKGVAVFYSAAIMVLKQKTRRMAGIENRVAFGLAEQQRVMG